MFLATFVAAVLCGVIGSFVVVKRIVFMSGGIAHATFGGIGFAYFIQSIVLIGWFAPMIGAVIVGISVALIMAHPAVSRKLREDSVIGVLWAAGMAIGVIFIALSDPSVVYIKSYEAILFGNVLLVSTEMVIIMAAMALMIIAPVIYLYRDLQILTFDESHARTSGINVTLMNAFLYSAVAVTCVLVMNVVGVIMVMALITIPASIAILFSKGMKETIILAVIVSLVLSSAGLILSVHWDRIPPGAMVAIVLTLALVISLIVSRMRDKDTSREQGQHPGTGGADGTSVSWASRRANGGAHGNSADAQSEKSDGSEGSI
ncbi:MAG: metal ABC transporter permease [Candidatus Methanoplasma sp.]|nr:metal ABC transporter permease [Candidatus Methanoplasma sp.]